MKPTTLPRTTKSSRARKRWCAICRKRPPRPTPCTLLPTRTREGEAIAWHIAEVIKNKAKNIKRIQFNEITARAVKNALEHPHDINPDLFDAQQARRVLDRLVGYKISPLLWKTVKRGHFRRTSAVGGAAPHRGTRRGNGSPSCPKNSGPSARCLAGATPPPFKAELAKIETNFAKKLKELSGSDESKEKSARKILIASKAAADALEQAMAGQPFVVTQVEEKERSRNSAAALHHVHAPADGQPAHRLHLQAHHGHGAAALRRHRARRTRHHGPYHLHANRLRAHCRRGEEKRRRLHRTALRQGLHGSPAARAAPSRARPPRRTPTKPSAPWTSR